MARLILSTTIFLLVVSCNTKRKEPSTLTNKTLAKDIFSFSVIDSLKKYSNQDSIVITFKTEEKFMTDDTTSKLDEEGNYALIEGIDTVDALFFKGKANDVNFGLTLKGAKLNFYQTRNDQWTITDSLHFFDPPVFINRMDINGDGYKDIRIASVLDKESGNLLTRVFLFNFKTKNFSHNYSYDQDNVEYDKANKFVRAWFYGTKGQASVKWKSLVSNNRLVVDSTIAYLIDTKNSKLAKIEFYKYGNSVSNPPAKVIDGDADSLWTIFSNTFWDSNDKIKKKKVDYE